jgi:methionine synthase I (cobalamin-dependent)
VLETLVDVDEAHAMIACVRAQTRLPLVASFVPRADGALLRGAAPASALAAARAVGADHVGFNCAGPAAVEAAVAACPPDAVTWCKPAREGADDDTLVAMLTRSSASAVVGGCCGVGPLVLARLPSPIRAESTST